MQTSVFSKLFAERPLEGAIERAAEVGYDGAELMARDPHLPADTTLECARNLEALLDEHGLAVPCIATYTGDYVGTTGAQRRRTLDDLERFLRLAETLDCDLVRHGPNGPPPAEATAAEFEQAATGMRHAADLAAEYDTTLCIEIHAGKLAETTASTLRLLERIDRENVGVIHDAGNLRIAGADAGPATVDALGDRLRHVHVKDEQILDDSSLPGARELDHPSGPRHFRPRLLGEGDVDFAPIVAALARADYDGFLTVECHVDRAGPDDDVRVAEHELAALEDIIESAAR